MAPNETTDEDKNIFGKNNFLDILKLYQDTCIRIYIIFSFFPPTGYFLQLLELVSG